jgi:hypothetical protein
MLVHSHEALLVKVIGGYVLRLWRLMLPLPSRADHATMLVPVLDKILPDAIVIEYPQLPDGVDESREESQTA